MDIPFIINETLLFMIGIGSGIIANLHLHKSIENMNDLKNMCDHQMKLILKLMAKKIKYKDYKIDKRYFYTLNDLITKSKTLNYKNENNVLFSNDHFINDYIHMREEQTQVLFEMYSIIEDLDYISFASYDISDFLKEVSKTYSENNNCQALKLHLDRISKEFKNKNLPQTRIEFENRAKLYVFLLYLNKFLEIKIEFSKKYKY